VIGCGFNRHRYDVAQTSLRQCPAAPAGRSGQLDRRAAGDGRPDHAAGPGVVVAATLAVRVRCDRRPRSAPTDPLGLTLQPLESLSLQATSTNADHRPESRSMLTRTQSSRSNTSRWSWSNTPGRWPTRSGNASRPPTSRSQPKGAERSLSEVGPRTQSHASEFSPADSARRDRESSGTRARTG
jgi:hypothetical protein